MAQGNEQRTSILPTQTPAGLGLLGSPYSPADALLTPAQIGVTVGDSLGDVENAVKGVGFYVDMIGFGAPSSSLTQGMPIRPLGVNYFLPTGKTCSNGASMWTYVQGVPQGTALGSRIQQAMQQMGLPPLRGLAPGMMEDAEAALDPAPLLGALFGSGYPQCVQATLPVGDAYGKIQDPQTGVSWIGDASDAVLQSDGLYYQTRWIQATDSNGQPVNLTRAQWAAAPKTMAADGTPLAGSGGGTTEGFRSWRPWRQWGSAPSWGAVGVLCLLAWSFLAKGRR